MTWPFFLSENGGFVYIQLIRMLYRVFFFLFLFYAPLSLAKYQVCSITINSPDEIQTFKKFLPQQDFNFVELLPSQINEKQDHSTHWFDEACEKQVKCDILVVSGHFGGIFFGESGYALPTELLEEKACQLSCPGILSNVKEIFLFGCNTLASKKKDRRSYQEYLKVLLDDGMARETAERVVAARYSPLGTPFFKRMNFIFSNSDTIYGFDELSPLGAHIRQPLSNYFQSINKQFGSYTKYIESKAYQRERNTELFQSLSHTSLNQDRISLSKESSSQKIFFKNKCLLYDDESPFDKRIQALSDIFHSKQAGSAFFSIDHFLRNNKTEVIEGRGRKTFRFIRTNKSFSNEFLSYYKPLNFLPYIKLVYLNVLEKFRWLDSFDLKILRKKDLLELIKTPDPEAYISLLLLLKNNQVASGEIYISKKDLPTGYIKNIWSLLIFEKLKKIAPEWQPDMLLYCERNIKQTPALCYQVLNTLAHIHPTLDTVEKTRDFLDQEDMGLIYYTIRMLGQSETEDYFIHKKISSFLTHKDLSLRLEALEALGFLQSPYADIQNEISQLLPFANLDLASDIFWSLSRMDVQGDLTQKRLIDYISKYANQPEKRNFARSAFSALSRTSEFSDYSLDFFYDHLEDRENLLFVFDLVELLSRNANIKDLGIHYRFLLFQQESPHIKKEVLKRMTFLTWLHPEVQISFLDYVRDTDSTVRGLAVNILRNIENLQNKTLREIRSIYKEENIKELAVFLQ